jgi:hypothetical protein
VWCSIERLHCVLQGAWGPEGICCTGSTMPEAKKANKGAILAALTAAKVAPKATPTSQGTFPPPPQAVMSSEVRDHRHPHL